MCQKYWKNKILQVFSDQPNVSLSFLKILEEHRRDAELNPLIGIDTCRLHTVHNLFKYGEKESNWNVKKLLNSILKLFDENPWCCADYERITYESKSDFPLRFCSHRWVENDVAKKAVSTWPKMIEVLDFRKGLPQSKQPGQGRLGKKKLWIFTFQMNGPLVPAKFHFPEQMPKKLNNFLVTFQTSSPKVLFIFDSLKNLVCSFVEKFILPDVSKKASWIWPIQIQKWELMK